MDELLPYPERQATSDQDILQDFTHGSVMLVEINAENLGILRQIVPHSLFQV